jgi:chitinase
MVKDASKRATFVASVVPFLKKYGFKGLDIDWEYPTQRGGDPADKENDVKLLQALRQEFDKEGFALTAAVSAGIPVIAAAYDIPLISQYLDHIHVMTYDFHGSWEMFTGINSPLYPKAGEDEHFTNFTIDRAIKFWIEKGAPKEKLVLGLPTYGHSWTLQNIDKHGINDTATGPGQAGPYTRQAGTIGYNEVCEYMKQSGWNEVYDDTYVSYYMYRDNQWLDYDDTDTLQIKTKYAMDLGLGGAMVWSIETDDFKGKCGKGPNPLLQTIHDTLGL